MQRAFFRLFANVIETDHRVKYLNSCSIAGKAGSAAGSEPAAIFPALQLEVIIIYYDLLENMTMYSSNAGCAPSRDLAVLDERHGRKHDDIQLLREVPLLRSWADRKKTAGRRATCRQEILFFLFPFFNH